jgi:nitrogen fixation-related uncharacterized protein
MTEPGSKEERVWLVEHEGRAYARLTRPSFVDRFQEAWQVEPLVEAESELSLLYSKELWHDRKVTFREPRTGVTVTSAVVVDSLPTPESPLVSIRGLSASRALGIPPVLATVAAVVLGLGLLTFHWTVARHFGLMFEDFGATKSLPLATRLALSPWCPPLLGIEVLGFAAVGANPRRGRLVLTIAAIVLGFVSLVGLYWGLYQPIYDLADSIKVGE